MVERQKKGGSKKKDKGSNEAPMARQKTLFDMFPTKVAKGPSTVITIESSPPETPDSNVETGSQPSTAVVPVDGYNSGIPANPNENILPDIDSSLESASILPQLSPPETLCIPSAANQDAAAPILSERVEGMTSSKPIVIDIDSSPIKPAASRPQGGVIHPFFVTRACQRTTNFNHGFFKRQVIKNNKSDPEIRKIRQFRLWIP
ncbi:hypothetical protein H1R20_g5378, partial [Candolleomyces eurysporus]